MDSLPPWILIQHPSLPSHQGFCHHFHSISPYLTLSLFTLSLSLSLSPLAIFSLFLHSLASSSFFPQSFSLSSLMRFLSFFSSFSLSSSVPLSASLSHSLLLSLSLSLSSPPWLPLRSLYGHGFTLPSSSYLPPVIVSVLCQVKAPLCWGFRGCSSCCCCSCCSGSFGFPMKS